MTDPTPRLALIVDDEPGILTTLSGILADRGYGTLCAATGNEAIDLYRQHRPDVVFLDIWLPDRDGLETLQAMRADDPAAAVVMMSGHGTTATAVKAIKMGAYDYLEKPLSLRRVVEAAEGAIDQKLALGLKSGNGESAEAIIENGTSHAGLDLENQIAPPPPLSILATRGQRQRTIRHSTVIYGLGLHSGARTGMVIQPLPPDSGIHFYTLPGGQLIPAHVSQVADTDYATTIGRDGDSVKTVEHFLSALHAAGITNLLIKLHGEIPVLDGSAVEFCQRLRAIGVEEQDEAQKELVIDRVYEVGSGEKKLTLEPYDGFSVSYKLRYPAPVGEQEHEFELLSFEGYEREIAPARTFGFMKDLKMMAELGLGSGGRLDNFILVGEDDVLNTELRFENEFARHKILDIIGDLFLLGYPIRGKVTASLTGHRDNIALLKQIWAATGA
jgi:UDP-3-O-acyl N-acetylglucosamine deacetylase